MPDFRQLSPQVWASPQITLEDVAEAARLGFVAIVNNRPDDEVDEDLGGAAIARAAEAAGLAYHAIPITPGTFTEAQARALGDVLAGHLGPVLTYCRSGTRSTLLWSLARAMAGDDPQALAAAAGAAGYDLGPVAGALAGLAERAGEGGAHE